MRPLALIFAVLTIVIGIVLIVAPDRMTHETVGSTRPDKALQPASRRRLQAKARRPARAARG